MKTFDKNDILTLVSYKDAEKYINCEGYFSDRFYRDLNEWYKGILKEVVEDATCYPFIELNTKGGISIGFGLFLPADKIREEEKKYRPFKDCAELCQHVRVAGEDLDTGLTFNIRNKENKIVRQVLVTEINYGKPFIALGVSLFDLENLFRGYEWQGEDNGEWCPFGVEVKEECI